MNGDIDVAFDRDTLLRERTDGQRVVIAHEYQRRGGITKSPGCSPAYRNADIATFYSATGGALLALSGK